MRSVPEEIPRPPYIADGLAPPDANGRISYPQHEFWDRIEVKSAEQTEHMRRSCALAREALEFAGSMIGVGVTTEAVDRAVHDFIVSRGAYPSPLGYMGFPKAVCTSINEIVAHGIPDSRPLADGDIVNVDVTVYLDGYHGDTSSMFLVGQPSPRALRLCEVGYKAMWAGISLCGPGVDFQEIGKAIEGVALAANCHSVPVLKGHGIGTYFHGAPQVMHVENSIDWGVMKPGMTFTVEPVIAEKEKSNIAVWEDGWTMTTRGNWTAQFEHTVLITEDGHEVLTGPSINYKKLASLSSGDGQRARSAGGKRPARRRAGFG